MGTNDEFLYSVSPFPSRMLCVSCGTQENHLNNLCKRCFSKAMHRRIFRWLKQQEAVLANDRVALPEGRSLAAVTTRAVFSQIVKFPHSIDPAGKTDHWMECGEGTRRKAGKNFWGEY